MKKIIVPLLLLLMLTGSCKSHKKTLPRKTARISSKKLLRKIQKNNFDAKTFESRFNIKYKDAGQKFNGNGKIRILKDSIIWGSINFMGIPVVKFYFTPSSVQYYNKIEKTYYKGDYKKLKEWTGADLDFYHLQHLLTGDALYPVPLFRDYELEILPGTYRFRNSADMLEEIEFSPSFKVVSEKLTSGNDEILQIQYKDFKEVKSNLLPQKIHLHTKDEKGGINVDLHYKNISLNKDLKFPFSIPSNYSKINF